MGMSLGRGFRGQVDALQPGIELRIREAREGKFWHELAVVVAPHLVDPLVVKTHGFADVGPLIWTGRIGRHFNATCTSEPSAIANTWSHGVGKQWMTVLPGYWFLNASATSSASQPEGATRVVS